MTSPDRNEALGTHLPRFPASLPIFNGQRSLPHRLLMTHSITTPLGGVEGMEPSRLLRVRDNFHTVLEELRPLVERARTSDLFSAQQSPTPSPQAAVPSHVITVEQPVAPPNNNNQDQVSGAAETLRQSPETRAFLNGLQKYVPFVVILLAKGVYDHQAGILMFVGLLVTFGHANSVVKREVARQNRRSLTSLCVVTCNLLGCIGFIYYIFREQKLYLSLVFIPPYSQPLSVWDLVWIVGVTDFVLKLVTIIVKVVVAALPVTAVPYQRRGKCYLFIETSSQLYRSLAPIQPWLYYLLESYQGPEKVVGVFLSAAYMVSKGTDLMLRARRWKEAFWKLLTNVTLGARPSKEQLAQAGALCPICHDQFSTPVLLQCRHIFCEGCVATWFDREQTCPLCRARVVDNPAWRDGGTTFFSQLY